MFSVNRVNFKQLTAPEFRDKNQLLFSRSVLSDYLQPRTAARQASLSFIISQSLLRLMSIESVMPSNHLILCCPLLPSIFPTIRVFSNELALRIRWPKNRSFSFSISPANEYSGQEATVRTGHGTPDWLQIGKGVHEDCILSPCLLNLYEDYIMRNAGLHEAQAGIKIARSCCCC